MALVSTSGLMGASSPESGSIARQAASVSTTGQMADDTKVSFRKTSDKGMAL